MHEPWNRSTGNCGGSGVQGKPTLPKKLEIYHLLAAYFETD